MLLSREKFLQDLKAGQDGEKIVARKLKSVLGAKSYTRRGADKTFDFALTYEDGRVEKFEVKTDLMAAKTGNLFLEITCSGKPSGLSSTLAAQWAILVPHTKTIVTFCPKIMLKHISERNYRSISGGDRKAVKGFLVPIREIIKEDFVKIVSL